MDTYFIDVKKLDSFISALKRKYDVYTPKKIGEDYHYSRLIENDKTFAFEFNKFRCIEPPKTFLTYPQEKLFSYFEQDGPREERPKAIFGFKNCDLASLKIQDYVYEEGIEADPLYKKRREDMLIISSDCTAYKDVCFCMAIGQKPYPEKGFDLNMVPVQDGFLFEVGSPKGEEAIKDSGPLFSSADADAKQKEKEKARRDITEKLRGHLEPQDIPPHESLEEIVRKGYHSEVWKDEAERCVECGACTMICGTCHCFLIADIRAGQKDTRYKQWDSCQFTNFSRVAGGANPMKARPMRLRNRFVKKFNFFPKNLGMYACTGCGRCIEGCPADIDIRKVLTTLHK